MDLDTAKTPRTRYPFHCMTLPPEASILSHSSSLFGCKDEMQFPTSDN